MSTNVVWEQSRVTIEERRLLNLHQSFCLWMTGLSGAGKSTIAGTLERFFYERGIRCYLLDGDNLRHGLNADLGFRITDRKESIRRTAQVARLFVDAGIVVIVSMISPLQEDRRESRQLFGPNAFYELYVECTVAECTERDPKGLYKRAIAGEIINFTGIDSPYEAPVQPEIHLNTIEMTVPECIDVIHNYLAVHCPISDGLMYSV